MTLKDRIKKQAKKVAPVIAAATTLITPMAVEASEANDAKEGVKIEQVSAAAQTFTSKEKKQAQVLANRAALLFKRVKKHGIGELGCIIADVKGNKSVALRMGAGIDWIGYKIDDTNQKSAERLRESMDINRDAIPDSDAKNLLYELHMHKKDIMFFIDQDGNFEINDRQGHIIMGNVNNLDKIKILDEKSVSANESYLVEMAEKTEKFNTKRMQRLKQNSLVN